MKKYIGLQKTPLNVLVGESKATKIIIIIISDVALYWACLQPFPFALNLSSVTN